MELSLSNLQAKKRKRRLRIGRGNASGHGTYSGRGIKGQKARSGSHLRPGFEGGRMPLIRQLPKRRGFTSFKIKPEVVNLAQLEKFFNQDERVTPDKLVAKQLIQNSNSRIKILGEGQLTKSITVVADAFSKTAEDAIKKIGGKIELR